MLTFRGQQTLALLQSLLSWCPGPQARRLPTLPGFAHGERTVSCPDCLTNDRLFAAGDYGALELALEWLRDVNAPACSLVWEALVYSPWGVPPSLSRVLEISVELLAVRMPERIRVPAWVTPDAKLVAHALANGRTDRHHELRARRAAEMARLRSEGVKLAELAHRFGVHRSTVCEILAAYDAGEVAVATGTAA